MENESSKRQLVSDLSGKWKLWTGGGFAAFAFGPTIKNIWERAGIVQAVTQNAAWLYFLPDQNWFQIGCLLAAAYFIWSALKEVQQEQRDKIAAAKTSREKLICDTGERIEKKALEAGKVYVRDLDGKIAEILGPVACLSSCLDDLDRLRELQKRYASQDANSLLNQYDAQRFKEFCVLVDDKHNEIKLWAEKCRSSWRENEPPEQIVPHDSIEHLTHQDHDIMKDGESKRRFFSMQFDWQACEKLCEQTIDHSEAKSSELRRQITDGQYGI